MKQWLYWAVDWIAVFHDRILALNDNFPTVLSDKQLHFLTIGIVGMILFFFFHYIFISLARHNHIIVISWFYVFTVILVITFAIEIGQKATGTGYMEFSDIVFGVFGFLFMFTVFAFIRGIFLFFLKLIKRAQDKHRGDPSRN